MKKFFFILITISLVGCSKNEESTSPTPTPTPTETFIRAADMSYLPLIESEGTQYKYNNTVQDPILTLKNAGCNTIRVRLWQNPSDGHCGLNEVKSFAQRIKQAGLKVWLSVHYSDTWADPGNQTKPVAWQSFDFTTLKNTVGTYTSLVMTEIQPDIIQIGNEINDGMLWPEGKLSTNESQYLQLVTTACAAVRANSSTTKIMLHHAGMSGSDWFFSKVATVDYDYIGLSYYPVWHGTDMNALQTKMQSLSQLYSKKILVAETAYPFTLGWNDWTNNIVGLQNQLVPGYDATADGQKNFLLDLKNRIKQVPNGLGFCYWGAEWLAFRGPTSTNGSSWENQALWDFNNNALPAMSVFNAN
ncbi:glycoside hydrolase family 53 protein [Flavobacterium stagni]|uniref:Arabinogalactan endo-beta-1,4-galactanase n=1 Tax=Flavobacterium stagni TaxID=2506421 RepID=A0A4Q1KBQ6_9FLAO|nr:glycosyl hydrolase 53 family protein [Flavobacterium stagni]RXR23919.1 arabinogalactan endo-1,4-beta-galactosidase [Flavobacterium stagni]